jgi:hypothetical protein
VLFSEFRIFAVTPDYIYADMQHEIVVRCFTQTPGVKFSIQTLSSSGICCNRTRLRCTTPDCALSTRLSVRPEQVLIPDSKMDSQLIWG